MRCQQCKSEYEATDNFCRKCGATIAPEAEYSEVEAETAPKSAIEAEILSVQIVEQPGLPVVPKKRGVLGRISKVVGGETGRKIVKAVTSEKGQQVVKSAAVLAVSVGAELIHQAAQKRQNQPVKAVPTPTLYNALDQARQQARPMMPAPPPPPPNAQIVETFVYERLVIKRWRRP